MNRCPSCDYPLLPDRERLGARCPHCWDPLYEPPGRVSRPARQGQGMCALHAGREAAGTCSRCGNYFCPVCSTRWRDRVFCVACAERALAAREATPEQAQAHYHLALFGLLMGLGAWVAFLLGLLVLVVIAVIHEFFVLILFVLFLFGIAMLLAVMGTGHAVAALRLRGQHMILATSALLISGLFLGVFLGNYILELWIM